MNNKWLIWIIVLLLIMNVSAVVTMFYHKEQVNRTEEVIVNPANIESASSMQYSGRWFRDQLQLSREQMNEFSRFNPVFRQRLRSINIELSEKRMQMLNELASEKSDTSLLNDLSDSIGALHSNLKKATYAYYLEFKKICTPQQQEKLKEIFNRMFEGEMPSGGPGRGMQGGRRFRMRGNTDQKNNN
jgi:Spy/CpxP family protein refolding chaperone